MHEQIYSAKSVGANRFTDFVAIPPLSRLVHTECADNFVGLSKQKGVARDAAERVSSALVETGLLDHPVTCSPGVYHTSVNNALSV